MQNVRKRKLRLYWRNPHCHWCGTKTIIHKHKQCKAIPDNAATVDHLYTRFDYMRGKSPPGVEATVLACNKCNFERGKARMLAEGLAALQKYSGRKPALGI